MTDAFMHQHRPEWVHSALFRARSVLQTHLSANLVSPARPNELRSRKTFVESVEHGCPRVSASMGCFARTSLALERKGKEAFEPTGSV